MKDNKKYPQLVDDAYNMALMNGASVDKKTIFKMMIDEGILYRNGQPTPKAYEEGLVADYINMPDGTSVARILKVFKEDNPILKDFDDSHFTWVDGQGWKADEEVIRGVAEWVIYNPECTAKQKADANELLKRIGASEFHKAAFGEPGDWYPGKPEEN